MSEKIEVVGGGETVEVSGDGDTVTIVGGGESVSIDIVEIGGTGKGVVVADNAPADTSVIWVDTSDDTALTTSLLVLADGASVPAGTADGTVVFYEAE